MRFHRDKFGIYRNVPRAADAAATGVTVGAAAEGYDNSAMAAICSKASTSDGLDDCRRCRYCVLVVDVEIRWSVFDGGIGGDFIGEGANVVVEDADQRF